MRKGDGRGPAFQVSFDNPENAKAFAELFMKSIDAYKAQIDCYVPKSTVIVLDKSCAAVIEK